MCNEATTCAAVGGMRGRWRRRSRRFLEELYERYRSLERGRGRRPISPSWRRPTRRCSASASPRWTAQVYEVGDATPRFTIQSISKPFIYGLALEDHGRERCSAQVGVEPTGDAFNSIVLDERSNRPFNPMVNAGAIATAGPDRRAPTPTARLKRMLAMFRRYAGRELQHRRRGVPLRARHRPPQPRHRLPDAQLRHDRRATSTRSLDLYFQQCSMLVPAATWRSWRATLANGGRQPGHRRARRCDARYVRDVLSVMLTCGMYDFAGEWAYSVGLPAKSGVGGGIVAVRAGPARHRRLLAAARRARQQRARRRASAQELSQRFGLHVFDASPPPLGVGSFLG